jgi:hypothetical protein
MALRETQKEFYALDLNPENFKASVDDKVNLVNHKINDAEKDGSLGMVASTYDYENERVVDGINQKGTRIITFANILKYNQFPVVQILENVLKICQMEMNNPVEIEFAIDIDKQKKEPVLFNLLQIRPIVENHEIIMDKLEEIPEENMLVYSNSALGNGTIQDIHDLIYVKPESFDSSKNQDIATAISEINDEFLKSGKNYIIIGPGRWGSSDPWLGIPVKWPQISAARVIIESGLENYRIDPSQGTHFFQNITSFKVGYFTINEHIKDGFINYEYLSQSKLVFENEFLRHIHFDSSVLIKIDGRKKIGVILKPED